MEMKDMESRRDVRCCYNGKVSSSHRRSKSDSERSGREEKLGSTPKSLSSKQDMEKTEDSSGSKKMPLLDAEVQNSLKQEILQLEKRLLDQFKTRCALEKALGCDSSAVLFSSDSSMPKSTKELVREIALLEVEVMYLEQYLLSLYRKAFNHQLPTLSTPTDDRISMPLSSHSEIFQDTSTLEISSEKEDPSSHVELLSPKSTTKSVFHGCEINCQEKLRGLYIPRSQSSLSQQTTCSMRISPIEESFARALRSCHSQPLSFLKEENNHVAREISLEEYIGASINDHAQDTPNKLSEEMVRCMCAIYCKLAEPPLPYHGPPSSPVSSISSTEMASPRFLTDSDIYKGESILESWLINRNPFQAKRLNEFSEPYSSMVEIISICQEPQKVRDVPEMLQVYKSVLHRLRKVELKMNHEEKLAFWINIHNALMMHAYVECGIPRNNAKRASFLVKANCFIGGRSINAATIQSSILCCRTHCSGQWNPSLPYSRLISKVGDQWQEYNIHQQEPVLHFALCSGCHSDPALRVYTPKRLFQQLEAAKEDFVRATVRISKEEKKILIPKIVDLYAKQMKVTSQALVDMIQRLLPETSEISIQRFLPQLRPTKAIECQPFNFDFRYLLSRELVE